MAEIEEKELLSSMKIKKPKFCPDGGTAGSTTGFIKGLGDQIRAYERKNSIKKTISVANIAKNEVFEKLLNKNAEIETAEPVISEIDENETNTVNNKIDLSIAKSDKHSKKDNSDVDLDECYGYTKSLMNSNSKRPIDDLSNNKEFNYINFSFLQKVHDFMNSQDQVEYFNKYKASGLELLMKKAKEEKDKWCHIVC